jgi:hypothetical protein
MGDRTPIEVIIYSCPPERVSEVLDAFDEFNLDRELALPRDREPALGPLSTLELGRGYIHSETLVGTSTQVAQALPKDAAWKVWEDPAYEHLGQVILNHPDLGEYVSDCDAQGRPMFNSGEVDTLVELTAGDRIQVGHRTGRTWEIALEQLADANNGIVLRRDIPPASAPLQSAALNQLASGPSRWMPAEAPGQSRATSSPDR